MQNDMVHASFLHPYIPALVHSCIGALMHWRP